MRLRRIQWTVDRRQVDRGRIGILTLLTRFDYEHEHRFTEHEHRFTEHEHDELQTDSKARTFAISEAEELTLRKSKTADRGLRLHRFVLALLRARAQHRGARARARFR